MRSALITALLEAVEERTAAVKKLRADMAAAVDAKNGAFREMRELMKRIRMGVNDDNEAIEAMDLGEIERGLEERIEKWTDEIKSEGKAEGLAEGREQSIFEEQQRVARKLLDVGIPVAQIQEITAPGLHYLPPPGSSGRSGPRRSRTGSDLRSGDCAP